MLIRWTIEMQMWKWWTTLSITTNSLQIWPSEQINMIISWEIFISSCVREKRKTTSQCSDWFIASNSTPFQIQTSVERWKELKRLNLNNLCHVLFTVAYLEGKETKLKLLWVRRDVYWYQFTSWLVIGYMVSVNEEWGHFRPMRAQIWWHLTNHRSGNSRIKEH